MNKTVIFSLIVKHINRITGIHLAAEMKKNVRAQVNLTNKGGDCHKHDNIQGCHAPFRI